MPNKTNQAAVNLLLGVGSVTAIGLGLTSWSGTLGGPLAVISGSLGLASAYKRDQRDGLTYDDYLLAVNELLDDTAGVLKDTFRSSKPAIAQTITVLNIPEPIKDLWTQKTESLAQENWASDFCKMSKLVFGRTRGGKTTWFKKEIFDFYKNHPDGRLSIIDMDFGSPDESGNRNFWEPFGTGLHKLRFIYDTYEKAFACIRWHYELLQERLAYCRTNQDAGPLKWQRCKLLADELPAIFRAAEMADKLKESHSEEIKDKDQLQIWISELLYRGLKQQIEVTFGAQNRAVTETGLNLAQQEQLNLLCLGSTAVDKRIVGSIPGVQDADALIEKVKRIRQLPGCKYAAIAKIGDEVSVKVIPYIDPSQYVVELPTDGLSETERWFLEAYTPELVAELTELAKEPKTALKDVAELFGLKTHERRNENPRYQAVKKAWTDLRASVAQNETLETLEESL